MKKFILSIVAFALILGSFPTVMVSGHDVAIGRLAIEGAVADESNPEAEILTDEQQATEHDIERLFEVEGEEDVEVNANALNYQYRRSWGGEGAVLSDPSDMAIDSEGRLLIVDRKMGRIIRVNLNDWSAEVKVLPGDNNKPIFLLRSIWVDDAGNVYIATYDSFFKIDKNFEEILMQSTPNQLAGAVSSIAVDSSGRVFVYDLEGIKVFDEQGAYLFDFCHRGSEEGQCGSPGGDLAFDSQDNFFVVDEFNDRIQKFTSDGEYILSIKTDYQYGFTGIAIDKNDNLYVSSYYRHKVCVYSAEGTFIREWGEWEWEDCDSCLKSPWGIAVKGQTVFVADAELLSVKSFTLSGDFISVWKSETKTSGVFDSQNGLAIDEYGNLYTTDKYKITKINPYGIEIQEFGLSGWPGYVTISPEQKLLVLNIDSTISVYSYEGDSLDRFSCEPPDDIDDLALVGIAVNNNGDIYSLDQYRDKVIMFSSTCSPKASWGGEGSGDGQFSSPLGISVRNNEDVLVVDTKNNRIQVFSLDGKFRAKFGKCEGKPEDLCSPRQIAVDNYGNIYIGSYDTWSLGTTLKVFSPDYQCLGNIGEYGLHAGNFQQVSELAISNEGYLFVLDRLNSRITQLTPTLPNPDSYSGLVQNGGFEKSPALMEWTTGGDLEVARTSNRYQGSYGMRLGDPVAQEEQGQGEAWAYTNFYVDPNWSRPVLKFKYRMSVNDILAYSDFFVAVQDGAGLSHLETVLRDGYNPCNPGEAPSAGQDLGWRTASFDLSKYKGQHIRINFSNRNLWPDSLGIWTDIDDVMVWDEGPLPYVGPYRTDLPLIFNRNCDIRAKGITAEENIIMRPLTPNGE